MLFCVSGRSGATACDLACHSAASSLPLGKAELKVLTLNMQGFPDHFALVGQQTGAAAAFNSQVRSACQNERYTQMGNAVCPLVSAAMGRCLVRAADHHHPGDADQFVLSVPDPDYDEVLLPP